jgi:hypothetical protein
LRKLSSMRPSPARKKGVWSNKSNGLERRGLQPRLVSSDCLLHRLDSGGISAIVSGRSPRTRLLARVVESTSPGITSA